MYPQRLGVAAQAELVKGAFESIFYYLVNHLKPDTFQSHGSIEFSLRSPTLDGLPRLSSHIRHGESAYAYFAVFLIPRGVVPPLLARAEAGEAVPRLQVIRLR